MLMLSRRTALALSGATGIAAALDAFGFRAAAAAEHGSDVYFAGEAGVHVGSTIILGERGALVVDSQLTAPDASALADRIEASGRLLETVFITHAHPDHYLGLAVLLERFPQARALTHAAIRPKIEAAAQPTLDFFRSQAPQAFAERVAIPDALEADYLELEGERFDIVGVMHGDIDRIAPVLMPQFDTLVAADLVYNDIHVWTEDNTTPDAIARWRASLDAIERIGAGRIIPGHRLPDTPDDASSIAWTRRYLNAWETALAETKTAADLRAAMIDAVGDLPFGLALDRGVAAARPS